jgi:hypothetical protein
VVVQLWVSLLKQQLAHAQAQWGAGRGCIKLHQQGLSHGPYWQ